MNPGELRHRVELQGVTRTRRAGGGETEDWETFATVWAAVEPLAGSEQLRAMQAEAGATHRVRIRYRAGLSADLRVIHRGRTLHVVAPPVNVDGRDREIHLLAREVSA